MFARLGLCVSCFVIYVHVCFVLFRTIRFLLLVFPSFPDLFDCLIESLVTGITAHERLPLEALRSQSPAPGARTFRKKSLILIPWI